MNTCPTSNKSTTKTYKDTLVLHVTMGSYNSAVDWLQQPNRANPSSAHYIVGKYGQSCEMVPPDERAWHAGNVFNASNRYKHISYRGKNPNEYCVGIEIEGGVNHLPTHKQWNEIIRIIIEELGDRFTDDRIITHRDIDSRKPYIEFIRAQLLLRLKIHRLTERLKKKLTELIKVLQNKVNDYDTNS